MPRIAAAEFVSDQEEGGEDETGHKEKESDDKVNKKFFPCKRLEFPPDQYKISNCRD